MIDIVRAILKKLPRFAEEGNLYTVLKKQDLSTQLHEELRYSKESITLIVDMLERFLQLSSVLEVQALEEGAWKFVSFSAQLFTYSLLESISDRKQLLLPESFWEQGNGAANLEEQRILLDSLEQKRENYHQGGKIPPIRYVYVAWAFLKFGDQILLYHREDKDRKHIPSYVLIGGKFHQTDLIDEYKRKTSLEKLQEIQSQNSEWVKKSLPNTLEREVQEETTLLLEDYEFEELLELSPYRKLAGAGANRVYTHYEISIFQLRLSAKGMLKLFDQITTRQKDFIFFSVEEILKKTTIDGKTAFIDAIHAHFSKEKELKKWLQEQKDSFENTYLKKSKGRATQEVEMIDLPFEQAQIFEGKTGKEHSLGFNLIKEQKQILWGLAWHMKDAAWRRESLIPSEGVSCLPYGWIKVDPLDLQQKILSLGQYLKEKGFNFLENQENTYFRLSIDPCLLHFDPKFFRYQIQHLDTDLWEFQLGTEVPYGTPIGEIPQQHETWEISENAYKVLKQIAEGGSSP